MANNQLPAKRIAASIISADLPIIIEYWAERYPEMAQDDAVKQVISDELYKYADSIYKRFDNLSKGIRPWKLKAKDVKTLATHVINCQK